MMEAAIFRQATQKDFGMAIANISVSGPLLFRAKDTFDYFKEAYQLVRAKR